MVGADQLFFEQAVQLTEQTGQHLQKREWEEMGLLHQSLNELFQLFP